MSPHRDVFLPQPENIQLWFKLISNLFNAPFPFSFSLELLELPA